MGPISEALAIADKLEPEDFGSLYELLDPAFIEEALEATGTATLRKRRLPAEQVVWLIIGMALYRGRNIGEVAASLDLALPSKGRTTVAPSALASARERLGAAPMEWLFSRTAKTWGRPGEEDCWRGLALFAADGSSLAVAETPELVEHFGHHRGGVSKASSGYPLMRIAWLMALRSRLVVTASAAPFSRAELTMGMGLFSELPRDSLIILDRLYACAPAMCLLVLRERRHFLLKAKRHAPFKLLEQLGPGDALVEVQVTDAARKKEPTFPESFTARCLTYQTNAGTHELLTSLLDEKQFPADEIRALYHERWEVELGYDELKTELLEHEVTLRSRTVENVYQEFWGALLAYNLIRLEMAAVAREARVAPNRISFVTVAWRIREEFMWCSVASPGAIPKHLKRLRADLARMILPPRRSDRSYPRAVKVKSSPYARKRPLTDTAK